MERLPELEPRGHLRAIRNRLLQVEHGAISIVEE